MKRHEDFAEPVGGVLFTRPFKILLTVFLLGFGLTIWRSVVGLGPATGLNDGYTWGLWKNFNVIVLTALGSGGYATALLFYVLGQRRFLPLARVSLVTSMLGYTTGIIALVVDLGRPWNFWRLGFPQDWNLHSVLLEVAICMSVYVGFLYLENAHPALETMLASDKPGQRRLAAWALPLLDKGTPWFVAAGVVLPSMHQSSLGSLFLLAGPRLHPLWQTPVVPLLFILSAFFLGWACVMLVVLLSAMAWKRPFETGALGALGKITAWVIAAWCVIRVADVAVRGALPQVFDLDVFAAFFVLELALLAIGAFMLFDARRRTTPRGLFTASLFVALGGGLYRYDTTTTAFLPGAHWSYFPSIVETLICVGYIALGVVGYLVMVKKLPVLPIADARARH